MGLVWSPAPWKWEGGTKGRVVNSQTHGDPPDMLKAGHFVFHLISSGSLALFRVSPHVFRTLSLSMYTYIYTISQQISKNEIFTLDLFCGSAVVCMHPLFSIHGNTHFFLQTFRMLFLELFFFPVCMFTLPLLCPFNLITDVFKGSPCPLKFPFPLFTRVWTGSRAVAGLKLQDQFLPPLSSLCSCQ